jgi:hypothetical protein
MWISGFGMHRRPDVRLLRKSNTPPNPGIEAPMFMSTSMEVSSDLMKMSIILDVDWLVKRCQGSIMLEGE